jgi:hypothetical protein
MKKQTICEPNTVPTANIAVNKSRLKVYEKEGEQPTYYLSKGQEFQIEIFNPTKGTILAKITLNNNLISQGGLILRPGQRVFLDRYLDVAKKFLFDTYEVSNTEEVKKAIEQNGDVKVEFFRETIKHRPLLINTNTVWNNSWVNGYYGSGSYVFNSHTGTVGPSLPTFTTTSNSNNVSGLNSSNTLGLNSQLTSSTNAFYSSCVHDGQATMDSLSDFAAPIQTNALRRAPLAKKSKSIETGRVEEGSNSDQKFKTVDKDFDWFAFHTVEYKLLPISQKVNTAEDINVKRYCTNCGAKLGKGHKFCATCGTKA